MCSAVCIYNQISTWAVSWMRLACIQLALHIYISCMMLSLWALSWDVYHTASSPVLLPSLLEKIICLARKINWEKSAILAGSLWPWPGNPVMSSEVVPAGHCVPSTYFEFMFHVTPRERTDLQWLTAGRSDGDSYRRSVPFACWQQGKNACLFRCVPKSSSVLPKGSKKFRCSLLKQCSRM